MDLDLPGQRAMGISRQIIEACPGLRVLVLSQHCDRHFEVGILHPGAFSYILKGCALNGLVRAIRIVASDCVCMSPGVAM